MLILGIIKRVRKLGLHHKSTSHGQSGTHKSLNSPTCVIHIMSSPDIQPVSAATSSSTSIIRVAPVGTARIIPPSAERESGSRDRGHSKPQDSATTPTSMAGKDGYVALDADRKYSRGKKKKTVRKVSLGFSVLAPMDEELFDGNTEVPTDVDDAAKEEALGCEIHYDGVGK